MANKKVYIRSMVVAPQGKVLIQLDLSQAESWIVAYLAKEENMKWSLKKSDIHSDTAAILYFPTITCPTDNGRHRWKKEGDDKVCTTPNCSVLITEVTRYVGKRRNHATAYRMGPERATQVINKDSDKPPYVTVTVAESKQHSELWHGHYHIKGWWGEIEFQLNKDRTLITPYRRQRTFFDAWGNELFKEATAYVPQSTVADHFNGAIHPELGIKGGLTEIRKQLVIPYADHKIVNQAHDSCILEVPLSAANDVAQRAKELLFRPLVIKDEEFTIPVDVEMGERWKENMRKIA